MGISFVQKKFLPILTDGEEGQKLLDILHPVNGMDSWIQTGSADTSVLPSLSNSYGFLDSNGKC